MNDEDKCIYLKAYILHNLNKLLSHDSTDQYLVNHNIYILTTFSSIATTNHEARLPFSECPSDTCLYAAVHTFCPLS